MNNCKVMLALTSTTNKTFNSLDSLYTLRFIVHVINLVKWEVGSNKVRFLSSAGPVMTSWNYQDGTFL